MAGAALNDWRHPAKPIRLSDYVRRPPLAFARQVNARPNVHDSMFDYDQPQLVGRQRIASCANGLDLVASDLKRHPGVAIKQEGENTLLIQVRMAGAIRDDSAGSSDRGALGFSGLLISFVPAGLKRTVIIPPGRWRGISIYGSVDALRRHALIDALPTELADLIAGVSTGLYFSSLALPPGMEAACDTVLNGSICEPLRTPMLNAKSLEMTCLALAALHAADGAAATNGSICPREMRQAAEALALIERAPGENHTLASVARAVGTNRAKLSHTFRTTHGETFYARLQALRMDRALSMLTDATMTVADVAQAVGYVDPRRFAQAFKARFSVYPSAILRSGYGGANPVR